MKNNNSEKLIIFKNVLRLAVLAFALLNMSCRFGLPEFLLSEEKVDERSSSITTLSGTDIPYMGASSSSSGTAFPEYSAVVITDVHFGSSEDRKDDAFLKEFDGLFNDSDINNWPRFVVCLGDSADTGDSDEIDDYNTFLDRICGIGNNKWSTGTGGTNSDYKFRVYTVLGNHDLYNNGWSYLENNVYPNTSYYCLKICGDSSTSGFELFFLDTANGTTGENQLSDFESHVDDTDCPKVVFTHYPVYCGGIFLCSVQDTSVRNRLLTAFADNNVKYVFEGHVHKDYTYSFGKFKERVIASYLYNREYCFVKFNESECTVTSEIRDF